ncbi:MAG: glycosyltransferase involved in cell wall biosynthesis [Planctomycetota bacterium]|jgi:glycosyltransferase involved in cell wall biosynthesis
MSGQNSNMNNDTPHNLQILAIDPWLGGSHAAFLHAWRARSRHDVEVVGLANRSWKWRMRAGAWELARSLHGRSIPQVMIVSDYLDLPNFFGFMPSSWAEVPCLLYMHENQLTYPLPEGTSESQRDTGYGFTNILSCLRASSVLFNSTYHQQDFSTAAQAFLKRLPKPTPAAELRNALAASQVIAPGVDLASIELGSGSSGPLRILYNQRWQFDKDPLAFLNAVSSLAEVDIPFELVLLGERFRGELRGIEPALSKLAPHIVHQGYAESRSEYASLLQSCDLMLSTALHEFFGISTVEAMGAGVTPLLPNRLSYPELVGLDPGASVLYNSGEELLQRLTDHARAPQALRQSARRQCLRDTALRYSDEVTSEKLDTLCQSLVTPTQ